MFSQFSRSAGYPNDLSEPPRFVCSHVIHADVHPAHKEAVTVFADVIRDVAGDLAAHPIWQMEVLDENGTPVFRLKVVGEVVQ